MYATQQLNSDSFITPQLFPVHKGGASAAGYGSMPDYILLSKMERTNIKEDPENMNNYQRSILKDTSTDAPYMESDHPRDMSQYSKSVLNLRDGGSRGDTLPFLDDGTFLDWEFLEGDPRSIMYQPDMRKAAEQSQVRAKYIPYAPDADNSLPESGLAPTLMNENIRKSQHQVGDRMKWFSTSFDSWTTGGRAFNSEKIDITNSVAKQISDSRDPTNMDLSQLNYSSDARLAQNMLRLGWESVGDHKIKISRYGLLPRHDKIDVDWEKNRAQQLASIPYVRYNDIPMPKSLVLTIRNLMQEKARDMNNADANFHMGDSLKHTNMKSNRTDLDPGAWKSVESRSVEICRLLQDKIINRRGLSKSNLGGTNPNVQTSGAKVSILDTVPSQQRRIGETEIKLNVKDNTEDTQFRGYEGLVGNKHASNYNFNPNANWIMEHQYLFGASKTASNYAAAKSSNNLHNMNALDLDAEGMADITTQRSNGKSKAKEYRGMQKAYQQADMIYRDEPSTLNHSGNMADKSVVRENIEVEDYDLLED